MTTRVLIGFADALAAIESAWCLVDHGFEVHAFTRRGSRPALGRSRAVRIVDITAPELNAARSVEDLVQLIQELSPVAVLPLDDQAIWVSDCAVGPPGTGCADMRLLSQQAAGRAAQGQLAAGQIVSGPVVGPIGQQAKLALDKRRQLDHAEDAGFAVPPSADAASGPPPGPGPGPWMVKPALAVELRAGRLCRLSGRVASTTAELSTAAAAIGGPAIAQPLIDGTGEGVFGLATDQGVVALSAHRRIRMMNPRGSGSSACRSVPVPTDLFGPVSRFIADTGWRGLFMIELLRDVSGRPWFMELNGRAWGSMALACRRGYYYPAWAVRAALDAGFVPAEPVEAPHLTARHLGREVVHLGAVLAHGGAPRLGTIRAVATVRRGEYWYNWRHDEAGVFAADAWATIRGQLAGGRRSS